MPSKTFCFCIPVRFGVFVISFLALALSVTLSSSIWYILAHQSDPTVVGIPNGPTKAAIIISGVYYQLLAIASLAGFVGACGRFRRVIAIYTGYMWASFVLNMILGVWVIVQVAISYKHGAEQCKQVLAQEFSGPEGTFNNAVGDRTIDCSSAPLVKAVFIAGFILSLLLMLWGCIVIHLYKRQLDEDAKWELTKSADNSSTATLPVTTQPQSSSIATREYGNTYPYTQSQTSFNSTSSYGKGASSSSRVV